MLNNTPIWGDTLCANCGQRLSAWADTLHGCCAFCGKAFPKAFRWLHEAAVKEKKDAREKALERSYVASSQEPRVGKVISLTVAYGLGGNGPEWTVGAAIQHRCKYSAHRGVGSVYAELTLRVEPYVGVEGCVFVNAVSLDDELFATSSGTAQERFWRDCVTGVVEGVGDVLRKNAEQGLIINDVAITLVKMSIHPVDSTPSVCRQVATRVLNMCLKRDNLVEDRGRYIDAE